LSSTLRYVAARVAAVGHCTTGRWLIEYLNGSNRKRKKK
jgi:hypothetical protein